MVDRRPCRTKAHSANLPLCLISASVVGGSKCPRKARSTSADLGFFGSVRGSDSTVASPTMPDRPPLRVRHTVPEGLAFALEIVDGIGLGVGFGEKVRHVYNSS